MSRPALDGTPLDGPSAPFRSAAALARNREMAAFFDELAPRREAWIHRHRAFYRADRRFMRFLVDSGARVLEIGCGTGDLLAALEPREGIGIDISEAMVARAFATHGHDERLRFFARDAEDPDSYRDLGTFDYVVLSDTLGVLSDVQVCLEAMQAVCGPDTRIVIAHYNPLWEPVLRLAERVGRKMPSPEASWLDAGDISGLLHLAGYEVIVRDHRQLLPYGWLGLGTLVNRHLGTLPGVRALCLRNYVVARSLRAVRARRPSCSVIVPARNERGNIENAVKRLPRFCDQLEIVFVEGGSGDGTYEECLRVRDAYPERAIKVLRQPGRGKGDATFAGFAAASGEVLMILDADLTTPPEDMGKFYEAVASGRGEFANGTRLVYPMEGGAMRLLNAIANHAFARIFSYLLNQRFTDTLCGTKVLSAAHYARIEASRSYFGDFDPFGDFDLIFGAAKQHFKVVEVPVRYADREYGETQISRFRHGLLLARMVLFAYRKLKAI